MTQERDQHRTAAELGEVDLAASQGRQAKRRSRIARDGSRGAAQALAASRAFRVSSITFCATCEGTSS